MKHKLYGLVLAGGKSQRMRKDKSLINWHGKEQCYYLAELLSTYCDETYISCRKEQQNSLSQKYRTLPDTYEDIGPYGALLSAMSKYPDRSWLVVACDMPFIEDQALTQLILKRDPEKLATAYKNPANKLPEPLLAIWEPKSKKKLLTLLQEGISCPRKALIKSMNEIKLIAPLSNDAIINVNTPEEASKAKILLGKL